MNGLLLLVGLLCTDSPLLEEFLRNAATPRPVPVVLARVKGTNIVPAGSISSSDPDLPKGTKGPIPTKDLHLPFEAEFLLAWDQRKCRRHATEGRYNPSRLSAQILQRNEYLDGDHYWEDTTGSLVKHHKSRGAWLLKWEDHPLVCALGIANYMTFDLSKAHSEGPRGLPIRSHRITDNLLFLELMGPGTQSTNVTLDRNIDFMPLQIVTSFNGQRLSTLDITWHRDGNRLLPVRWRQQQVWDNRLIAVHDRELIEWVERQDISNEDFRPPSWESRRIEDYSSGTLAVIEPNPAKSTARVIMIVVLAGLALIIVIFFILRSRRKVTTFLSEGA